MERGLPQHRHVVVGALRAGLSQNARHEHASFLIQRALKGVGSCRDDGASEMATELLSRREIVQSLARNQFGRYVLKDLARSTAYAQLVRDALMPMAGELQCSKQGKKLLSELVSRTA